MIKRQLVPYLADYFSNEQNVNEDMYNIIHGELMVLLAATNNKKMKNMVGSDDLPKYKKQKEKVARVKNADALWTFKDMPDVFNDVELTLEGKKAMAKMMCWEFEKNPDFQEGDVFTEPDEKDCGKCYLEFDWRIDGCVKMDRRSMTILYYNWHNGECVKSLQSKKVKEGRKTGLYCSNGFHNGRMDKLDPALFVISAHEHLFCTQACFDKYMGDNADASLVVSTRDGAHIPAAFPSRGLSGGYVWIFFTLLLL